MTGQKLTGDILIASFTEKQTLEAKIIAYEFW